MIATAVTVDADQLERLLVAYHTWVPDDPDVITARALDPDPDAPAPPVSDAVLDECFAHCRCGWTDHEHGAGHANHVAYHVRQALAGRIEL